MSALSDAKTAYQEMDLDGLRVAYHDVFGEETDTNDKTSLVTKLAYAKLLSEAGDDPPKALVDKANAWFDRAFKTVSKKEPRYTIQMFITDTLWRRLADGTPVSAEELGSLVCEKYPESTYKKDPTGRAKVDIMKFNKGLFPYQKKAEKIPTDETGFIQATDMGRKKKKEEEPEDLTT